jgi:hypothetical protein
MPEQIVFTPDMLPPRPQIIPPELRHLTVDNTTAYTQKLAPDAIGRFMGFVMHFLSKAEVGVKVDLETREDGWTLNVTLPQPREDVVIPGDID